MVDESIDAVLMQNKVQIEQIVKIKILNWQYLRQYTNNLYPYHLCCGLTHFTTDYEFMVEVKNNFFTSNSNGKRK